MRISELVDRANRDLEDEIQKLDGEEDLETLSEILDRIGSKADRYASIFSNAKDALNVDDQDDEEQNMQQDLRPDRQQSGSDNSKQKQGQRQTTGSRR